MQGYLLHDTPSRNTPTPKSRLQFSTTILNYATSILITETWILLNPVRRFTFLKIMKRWSRWSSRAEVQQWDTFQEPTDLRLIGYLTESTWTQNPNQICWHQKPTRRQTDKGETSHVMSGTNLLHLLNIRIFSSASCPEVMSKRMQQGTGEEKYCGKVKADVEPGFSHCGKLSYSAEQECIQSPSETHSTQSTRFESHSPKCRETCRWRFKSKWRSVTFSSVANRCKVDRKCEEPRCCRHEPGSEFPGKCKETCRRKFRNHRRRLGVAEQLPHISCLRSTSRESPLESATATQSQARRQCGRPLMCIRWLGECLWLSLSKPRFILETIIWRIYVQPKISHNEQ